MAVGIVDSRHSTPQTVSRGAGRGEGKLMTRKRAVLKLVREAIQYHVDTVIIPNGQTTCRSSEDIAEAILALCEQWVEERAGQLEMFAETE